MKTKQLIAITTLLMLFGFAGAQDLIIFKTGDEVKAKVTEVGIGEIKYKKADNPNGPVYITSKAEVFMIKYENGTKDVFAGTQFTEPRMHSEKQSDYSNWRRTYHKKLAGGIVMTAIGAPMLLPGLVLFGIGAAESGNRTYDNYGYRTNDASGLLVPGLVLLGAGLPLTIVGALKIKGAKRYKAQALKSGATMSFNPILAPSGVGQAANFRAGAGMRINF